MVPASSQLARLKPQDSVGWLFVGSCSLLTGTAVGLSYSGGPYAWVVGQVVLSAALLQWFVLLHEAGHCTLFHTRALNTFFGHIASFFALIPFHSWKLIHDRHHVWTGWQDLDATTEPLVPRTLKRHERFLVNLCWKTWLPLFSIIYRLNNFWNLPRLRHFVSETHHPRILKNIAFLLVSYGIVVYWLGLLQLVSLAGLAVFLTLVYQDPLLLSQHTHIPQHLSRGQKVKPFSPLEQEQFTRSIKFPSWLSAGLLLNFGAHELHHMYVQVPGYCLDQIAYLPRHEMQWWRWLLKAKRVPGEVFLFQNQTLSGLDL
jgi:fatty acid desaturase